MEPHISLPRQHGSRSTFGVTAPSRRGDRFTMPHFDKRWFNFSQMDFERAIWEMIRLVISPKQVFKSSSHHKQTRDTWQRSDPSFLYLLLLFLSLTGLAWGVAYTPTPAATVRVVLVFVFMHFLASSLLMSTISYFLLGRCLGAGLPGLPWRRRQGLFGQPGSDGGAERLDYEYCFCVSIRAFFPLWVFLYALQFVLMPLISKDHWVSLLVGNSLYLLGLGYYVVVTYLGYNALPFLQQTELLLAPLVVLGAAWVASLFGFNVPKYVAPLMLKGAQYSGV